MKKIILIIIALGLLAGGFYFWKSFKTVTAVPEDNQASAVEGADSADTTQKDDTKTIIGTSVEGRDITAYHYGDGDTELLFVGGIHGGYEWNTSLVAYELMDYLESDPGAIPSNVKVTVIPTLNPDGLYETLGTAERFTASDVPSSEQKQVAGRFNANDVDLNRNFDCEWQAEGTWQDKTVSGGDSPFSEPESAAIRSYVNSRNIAGAVVWYSAAGGVFASACNTDSASTESRELTKLFADASGYAAREEFDYYAITGDMVNWFAKRDIPAISVLLTTHEAVEWDKNQKGIDAILEHYAQ